jgi:hypothetical protein
MRASSRMKSCRMLFELGLRPVIVNQRSPEAQQRADGGLGDIDLPQRLELGTPEGHAPPNKAKAANQEIHTLACTTSTHSHFANTTASLDSGQQ